MRGGGRSLAYQHPENLLPGLNNQVPHLCFVLIINPTRTSCLTKWHITGVSGGSVLIINIINTMRTSCLTTLQVSVRFWPGLWRGSEGLASRDELLLVMRDVEQVGRHIVKTLNRLASLTSLNLPPIETCHPSLNLPPS